MGLVPTPLELRRLEAGGRHASSPHGKSDDSAPSPLTYGVMRWSAGSPGSPYRWRAASEDGRSATIIPERRQRARAANAQGVGYSAFWMSRHVTSTT
jgi:hypothetical protein